jgi:cyclopropane-fatty-acyl-phospholipid synthase
MNDFQPAAARFPRTPSPPRAARHVLALLSRLQRGSLDVQLPDGGSIQCGAPGRLPRATLRIKDWAVAGAVLSRGDIGFGESYVQGHWSSQDLVALMRLFLVNRSALEQTLYGRWWGALWSRLRHLWNRNSRRGSRRNIVAHYDLGNAFYRLWLDPSMNYSSAWFERGTQQSLHEAQQAKMRRALSQLGLKPGQRLLEIGCGWGAVAEMAARELQVRVTGVTLSREQWTFARERLQAAGLAQACDLRLQDYRDIPERGFDAVISIEMFEAVGHSFWGTYFAQLHQCLKPGGLACVQSITLRDALWQRYSRSSDFIQQYIFPGGMLPSIERFEAAARRAGLVVEQRFAFGCDYAETLRRWRLAFLSHEAQVRAQGFDERFVRLWEFYLAYCEAAFAEGDTNVVQFNLRRPA